jgi:O-antigen ligase
VLQCHGIAALRHVGEPAHAKEIQMLFGGGILGTILLVVLIIFVVRRL